jgi:RNA polymerase sigma factor for flagellar operon FliA
MASLFAPPGDDDEAQLWSSFRQAGSQSAREKLFGRHIGFASSIARRHFREKNHGDLELADLQQWAYAGLLEAIERFDPERGIPFRGYAARRVSGSILNGVGQMSEVREQLSARGRIERDRLRSLTLREPDAPEAREAILALADLVGGLAVGFMLEGTGLFVDDEEAVVGRPVTAYDSAEWRELIQRLEAELAALPEREQTILRHHYLAGVGFDQIAALLGVSKGRISQLHRAALARLRLRLSQRGHFNLQR